MVAVIAVIGSPSETLYLMRWKKEGESFVVFSVFKDNIRKLEKFHWFWSILEIEGFHKDSRKFPAIAWILGN